MTVDGSPTISATVRSIINPTSAQTDCVTTAVADDGTVSSVTLSYTTGGTGIPTSVFTETMAATATTSGSSWTGTGANYAWTVTEPSGKNYVTQATSANYGSGNACGLQFTGGDTTLADTMVATTNGINVAGTSATVLFYLETPTVSTSEGWAFQINSGTGWVTCLSETDSKHGWQGYSYTLTSAQLTSSMQMRFQFTGNSGADTVCVDDITVTATFGTTTVATMYDDGTHGDGAAGDGVYGAYIPAQATGTLVCYHVTATDNTGLVTTDPASSSAYYSYVVGQAASTVQLNEFLANPTTFTATTDYPTQAVGTIINTGSEQSGYTLVDPMFGTTTYLINNAGQVVHSWTSTYQPGRSCYLLPNGDLIRAGSLTNNLVNTGGGEGGIIEERDWNGNLLWSYVCEGTQANGVAYMQHHDFQVLPNGDILALVVELYTDAQALAAGFNPSLLNSSITTGGIEADGLMEIQPSGTTGGTVVWQWNVWDHLVQNYSSSQSNYGSVTSPYLINCNAPVGGGTQIPQFWNHVNSIQYNASLDEIILIARNESEVWVIDHSTTTTQAASHSGGARGHGGDLLYRWGNPQEYGAGTAANEILYQQHDAQWIPAGYPGAGDILVFNNGDNRPGGNYTSIDQFTPASDGNGNYTTPATGSAYGPSADDWTWTATPATSFYNSDIGGVQREPNGDTLINYGNKGEAWEVNTAGQIVWEYQNPCYGSGMLYQGDAIPVDPHSTNGYLTAMFRCERYPLTYAAFSGKTLTPGTTLETYRDAIELHNTGTSAVTLSGMYLTNNLSLPTLWQIPTGTSIVAGGYLVFYADGQTSATTASGRHTSFTLSASGGSIGLFAADGVTPLDTITYGVQAANVSYGRAADGSVWGPMASATLGTANGTLASVLAFSNTTTGTYGGTTALAATLTENGLAVANEPIRFTLNGTSVGTATTNSSGIATLAGVSLARIHAGSYSTALAAAYLGDSVYAASSATGALLVTAAPLTITADSKSKVYGAALPTLTASYSGFVNGDTAAKLTTQPSLSTTATAASHVSGNPYAINANGAVDSDYTISYVAGTLTVTAAPLTITADNKIKVYCAALPTLTASYSGFVNGDTAASLTTLPALSTTATATGPVGAYPITASGAVDPDYTISYVPGTLTVTTDPTVTAILVENGLTERSYVDQLTFQFSKPVSSTSPVPMTLTDFGMAGTLNQSVTLTSGQFQWTTVPGSGNSVLAWSLESFAGGTSSLPDGYYQLRLSSSSITDAYGFSLDGDGDGQPGGDYVANFFVLQGDANGDGVVSNSDMLVVNAALGSLTGDSNWNPNADLNRNGAVTTSDRIIVYNSLGNSITPPASQGTQVAPAVAGSLPAWSFGSSTPASVSNTLPAGSPVSGITFGAGMGAATLAGNAIELNGDVTNQSVNTQIVALPLTLTGGDRTIDTAAGNVTIAGGIGQSGGSFGIIKTGSETLVLSGVNTYSGGTAVYEGTLVVTSANALPDGTSLVIGAGGAFIFDPSQNAASTSAATTAAVAQSLPVVPVSNGQPSDVLETSSIANDKTVAVPTVAVASNMAILPRSGVTVGPHPVLRTDTFAFVMQPSYGPKSPASPASSAGNASATAGAGLSDDHKRLSSTSSPAQAHDMVLQLFGGTPRTQGIKAAAAWNWGNSHSNRDRTASSSAVDAVMAMLQKM